MKKLLMVLSVVALLGAGISFGNLTHAKEGGQELVVEAVITSAIPGISSTLDKGEAEYVELDVFRVGEIGVKPPIGAANANLVATEPVGTGGAMGQLVYRIFGKGEIHVSLGPGSGASGRQGAIAGGTGLFRGVTGEYSHKTTSTGPVVLLATFKFNRGKN